MSDTHPPTSPAWVHRCHRCGELYAVQRSRCPRCGSREYAAIKPGEAPRSVKLEGLTAALYPLPGSR